MLNPDGYDLVVMDALPLFQLGRVRRLDLLLGFSGGIFIPDEVAYEATEFFDQSQPVIQISVRIQIRAWLNEQAGQGRVLIVKTLVGEAAEASRRVANTVLDHLDQALPVPRPIDELRLGLSALAAHDLLSNINPRGLQVGASTGHALRRAPGQMLLLVGEVPRIQRLTLNDLKAEVVGTYEMLVMLERSGLLASAQEVWARAQSPDDRSGWLRKAYQPKNESSVASHTLSPSNVEPSKGANHDDAR
jgi:hypothetical protein